MQGDIDKITRINKLKALLGLSFVSDDLVSDDLVSGKNFSGKKFSDARKVSLEQQSDNCPDEEIIACYFDKTLTSKENKEFISLLTLCPASYTIWLTMVETLGFSNKKSNKASFNNKSYSFYEYIKSFFSSRQIVFTGAIATTFLFVMVVNFSFIPFSKLPIDQQIVKIWQSEEVLDLAYIDISEFTPKARTKAGFNIMPFPEKIAFSSGFKQGLINMSSVSDRVNANTKTINFLNALPSEPQHCKTLTCEKENYLNQQLGIWSSFVLQECQQNQRQNQQSPVKYWKKQNIVINHFIQNYKNLSVPTNTLIVRVTNIQNSLGILTHIESNNVENQIVACNSIKQMALYSIQDQL
jgi:hypothetical protein